MELRDRVALITGGKRIGAAIAIDLARRGMDVALSFNRSRAEAEDAAAAIREASRCSGVRCEMSSGPDRGAVIVPPTSAISPET